MNIFILSYRFSGNDGVSLEAVRWSEILKRMGNKVSFVAGELDRAGILIPELHFQSPEVSNLHDQIVYSRGRFQDIEAKIFELAGLIEGKLRELFNKNGKVDLLIVPNIFSLPMHFSLSVALARVIDELNLPTIARHHDFWWERQRYLKSSMFPFFERWFPPSSKNIFHVVINSSAKKELKDRKGIDSVVISDCFDFDCGLNKIDDYSGFFRKDFGIDEKSIVFLQPTRIVPRKRIEISIKLLDKLNHPNSVLVLAGKAGDEGFEYEKRLKKLARSSNVNCKFVGRWIDSKRRIVEVKRNGDVIRRRVFTLWDAFVNADIIVYPTRIEGFGNQFVESVFFKKPIILTPYPVYNKDIKPLGFEAIEISDKVNRNDIKKVRDLIENKERINSIVAKNFSLGKRYFSYENVKSKLEKVFRKIKLSNPNLKI